MATKTGGKLVYRLAEGSADMVGLLGSKGAHASEMARIGIPVPPGFVITTEACLEYFRLGGNFPEGLWDSIVANILELEKETGRKFGDPADPLIVSVRSGAAVSMPGMMDTILNMGVVDSTVQGLSLMMNDERPAWDAYRRLIQGFGSVVLGIEKDRFESALEEAKVAAEVTADHELAPDQLKVLTQAYKRIVSEEVGQELPQDPWELLRMAVEAVFASWNNPRAITYREHEGIAHDLGTGCVIMAMVFGNLGPDSGTGVLFTRSPATGERLLYGEFLANAQGEDVVAGVRTPSLIESLRSEMESIYEQIELTARQLEAHYRDVQDIEFTVERGQLYILQTRSAKRTAPAAVRIAVEFVAEGVLTKEEAIARIAPAEVGLVLLPRFDVQAKANAVAENKLLAQGVGGSPGAASGLAVMDPDKAVAWVEAGSAVVLVRPETSPDDVHGIIKAEGVLTSRGGMTSHAAVVTRGLGKPCVVGCEELHFDMHERTATARGRTFAEGDFISIDGGTGEVFAGAIPSVAPSPDDLEELQLLLSWADDMRTMEVWANADSPEDALRAWENGAQGIGLCRTEHMFFNEERLPHIQRLLEFGPTASKLIREAQSLEHLLVSAPASERSNLQHRLSNARMDIENSEAVDEFHKELARLEEFQTSDFTEILRAMGNQPVVIRLLDAPLHEFVPHYEDLLVEIEGMEKQGAGKEELEDKRKTLELVEGLRESNPMLGHRGCRVGLTMPEIYEMQVRAIVTAACRLTEQGLRIKPEIMIPIVSHVNELKWLRPRLRAVASATRERLGVQVTYKFGTMIEVPRAALTAGEIASEAEFFSFGSNDLTQMTFAFSRDDAEGKFLRHYVESEVLPWNPFSSLDTTGVGKLMRIAVEEGRAASPGLSIGICGEHGGDPKSVAFCHQLGLDYVSASPFRVPVARLAAAQSALGVLKPQ